ncbi:MAG: fatty acid desaturase [Pseudomonadota bacterium]
MTDHRAIIAALPETTKAALTTRSNLRGLGHLAGHFGAMAFTGGYIAGQAPFWGLMLLPHGILMVFLFTLSHECTHQTPFRTRWLNDAVGLAVAPLLVLPFFWFRYFHLAHHRFTNDPDRDPELAGGGRPATWRAYLIYLCGWGYWRGNIATLWQNAFGRLEAPYLPARRHAVMRAEARALIGLYVLFAISLIWSPVLIWLWLVPVLIAQPFLRLYLLAEHGHCPPVANMLENTRTTLTNRIVRWLAWNMPYHAEHHSYPAVPFHQLPALHALMADDLRAVSPSYTDFTKRYAGSLEH